jgi:hypothetical protein
MKQYTSFDETSIRLPTFPYLTTIKLFSIKRSSQYSIPIQSAFLSTTHYQYTYGIAGGAGDTEADRLPELSGLIFIGNPPKPSPGTGFVVIGILERAPSAVPGGRTAIDGIAAVLTSSLDGTRMRRALAQLWMILCTQ